MENNSDPIVRMAYAILLSAEKKRATEIWIRRDGAQALVSFKLDDAWCDELEMPLAVHARVVRRIGVMASLPTYGKDQHAQGTIVLEVGDRSLSFDVRVRGHGDALEAQLRPSPST